LFNFFTMAPLVVFSFIAFVVLAERWGIQVPPDLDTHPDPARLQDRRHWVDLACEKVDVKAVGLNHLTRKMFEVFGLD